MYSVKEKQAVVCNDLDFGLENNTSASLSHLIFTNGNSDQEPYSTQTPVINCKGICSWQAIIPYVDDRLCTLRLDFKLGCILILSFVGVINNRGN